jgi:hypothetical protein
MTGKPQLILLRVPLVFAALAMGTAAGALADPLPGRDRLKFSQQPMIKTSVLDDNGVASDYYGHDELSTAYGGLNAPIWDGRFMADDFADKLTSPVVHVKWWGSYIGAAGPQNPNMPVNKFLISFESDMPAGPAPSFSRPDKPLLNQVVFRNPLALGSGTFTEKLIRGPDPILGEALYEYNAELHLGKEFMEVKDTVYWLKIVAMVDDLPGVTFDHFNPQNSPFVVTQWGWHNRDYTVQDTYASTNVTTFPFGEFIEGTVGGGLQPVWHFQDDAVQGDVEISANAAMGIVMPNVLQPVAKMSPTHYLDGIDGPASMVPGNGIGRFSKDLAFALYTIVPEPGTCLMLLCGIIGLGVGRRDRASR